MSPIYSTWAPSLTFTSNAPYGFADQRKLEYDITFENEHFYLSGDSDEIGIVYPKVAITFKQDCETFSIFNITTDTTLILKNCLDGEVITIDGEHKVILSNVKEHTTLYNDFNYEYLDILVKGDEFNENMYEVSAPCLINIEYYPIRKVGVY